MSLQKQINTDIITAMKARDEVSLRALRALKSALLLAASESGAAEEVPDEQAVRIFQKLARQRKDSMEIYLTNGRKELAEKEREEIAVIEKYLPAQLGEEQIREKLAEVLKQLGATSQADFGRAMPEAIKALAGMADGKQVSAILKQLLS
jgi:uncharacterized protein YqeY